MPAPTKITFTFDKITLETDESFVRTGLALLPDGRLVRAGGFDDGVPFAMTVVPYAKAALAPEPTEPPA